MKKIKHMIETAPTKSMAMDMLNTWKIFGNITERQYEKGRQLIREEFNQAYKTLERIFTSIK